jgi:lipopolysaccharide transport system ATP-binding protein
MSELAIHIENIGKQYRIGGAERINRTLRETLTDAVKAPFRRLNDERPTFWALNDVSFDIHYGEVVGLIGRNGAGKSTLLKILSRITQPTKGRISLHGRVGSLLEVGTGFHPELTGRENVLMNGAILGMKRREIERKFDEIVAFAEIEKFIDTPVKFYSSGMYLRLAFSVAAHLETEILLVDEVLAVGDMNFQRKCLSKMEDVGQQGRTIIFVSHNLAAIKRLCPRSVLLENGQLRADGPTNQVVSAYMNTGMAKSSERYWDEATAPTANGARMRSISLRNPQGEVVEEFDIRQPITIVMEYDVFKPGYCWASHLACSDEEGTSVFFTAEFSEEHVKTQDTSYIGRRISTCTIPGNMMGEGTYTFGAGIYSMHEMNTNKAFEHNVVKFSVFDPMTGDSARGVFTGYIPGVMRPMFEWRSEETTPDALPSPNR